MRRLLALLLAPLTLAGCGLGAGEEREGRVELRVTRDFGNERLASASKETVREDETVMRYLQSERDVKTRYGGKFVQAIDGLSGGGPAGGRDWFFFVNGIESSVGAADYELSPGDVVQWDFRDWRAQQHIPAIVGAWPEPFLHGIEGKRVPVRVECLDEASDACGEVKARLREAGVPATGAALGTASGERTEVIRVVVGEWEGLRRVRVVAQLEKGSAATGVFARVRGGRIELLDPQGRTARIAPAGTGLVGASALEDQALVYFVTGLDTAGVEAGARALDADTLRDAFALAVTPEGPVRLPIVERDDE